MQLSHARRQFLKITSANLAPQAYWLRPDWLLAYRFSKIQLPSRGAGASNRFRLEITTRCPQSLQSRPRVFGSSSRNDWWNFLLKKFEEKNVEGAKKVQQRLLMIGRTRISHTILHKSIYVWMIIKWPFFRSAALSLKTWFWALFAKDSISRSSGASTLRWVVVIKMLLSNEIFTEISLKFYQKFRPKTFSLQLSVPRQLGRTSTFACLNRRGLLVPTCWY